jgi:hypothetical protein
LIIPPATKFVVICFLLAKRNMSAAEIYCELCVAIVLPLVLYGCETWSLTLRDEHNLRVFENRALRRVFGPKRK